MPFLHISVRLYIRGVYIVGGMVISCLCEGLLLFVGP